MQHLQGLLKFRKKGKPNLFKNGKNWPDTSKIYEWTVSTLSCNIIND